MKKLFIVLAAALLAVNVNAAKGDLVLSGNLDFSTTNEYAGLYEPVPSDFTSFEIAPSLTYFLSDKLGVGGYVSFNTSKQGDADAVNTFGLGVFGRYYFLNTGKFGIFGQATLGFEFPKDETRISLDVEPGIQYFINKKFSIEARLNNVLRFAYAKEKDQDAGTGFNVNVNPFELDFNALTFSLNYHF